jgi:hypothetical protein
MVDRGIGRLEDAQAGRLEVQPRRRPESHHGQVRKPAPLLPLVHPRALEPLVQALREARGAVACVVEHDHPHAPRLAVTARREGRKRSPDARLLERLDDDGKVRNRPVPEEGERDVQLLRAKPTEALTLREGVPLPRDEVSHDGVREPQGAEEPKPFTALDASGKTHA